jgi:hypothetical protein
MFVKAMISMKMFELLCYRLKHCCRLLKLYFCLSKLQMFCERFKKLVRNVCLVTSCTCILVC